MNSTNPSSSGRGWSPLRPRVTDARGRRVPLISIPNVRSTLEVGGRTINRAQLEKLAANPRKPTIALGVILAVAWILIFESIFKLLDRISSHIAGGGAWWLDFAVGTPIAGGLLLVMMLVWRGLTARRVAASYAEAGLCASCGYDLESISAEPDGAAVCPECGATWRLPAR